MKTVQERAQDVMSVFRAMLIETTDGQVLTGEDLVERITESMRGLAEDLAQACAAESFNNGSDYSLGHENCASIIREAAGLPKEGREKRTCLMLECDDPIESPAPFARYCAKHEIKR